jgi:hypothetical protein
MAASTTAVNRLKKGMFLYFPGLLEAPMLR